MKQSPIKMKQFLFTTLAKFDWLDALEESIRENTSFTLTTHPNKCAFSVWYANFESTDADLKEVLLKFDAPHKHLHQQAKELIKLAENNVSVALEKLIIERQTTWVQLSKLFEITRERITSNIRPIIVFVEQNNQKISALRLDKIQDIEDYSIEQFSKDLSTEGIMKKNQDDFVIEGFLRVGNQPPYMLINCQPQK